MLKQMKTFKDYLAEVPDDHKQEMPSYACMTAYINMLNDIASQIERLTNIAEFHQKHFEELQKLID